MQESNQNKRHRTSENNFLKTERTKHQVMTLWQKNKWALRGHAYHCVNTTRMLHIYILRFELNGKIYYWGRVAHCFSILWSGYPGAEQGAGGQGNCRPWELEARHAERPQPSPSRGAEITWAKMVWHPYSKQEVMASNNVCKQNCYPCAPTTQRINAAYCSNVTCMKLCVQTFAYVCHRAASSAQRRSLSTNRASASATFWGNEEWLMVSPTYHYHSDKVGL